MKNGVIMPDYNSVMRIEHAIRRIEDPKNFLNEREAMSEFYYNSLKERPYVGAGVNLSKSPYDTGGAFRN